VGDLGPRSKKRAFVNTIVNINRRFNEKKTFYKPQYTIRNIIDAIKYPSNKTGRNNAAIFYLKYMLRAYRGILSNFFAVFRSVQRTFFV